MDPPICLHTMFGSGYYQVPGMYYYGMLPRNSTLPEEPPGLCVSDGEPLAKISRSNRYVRESNTPFTEGNCPIVLMSNVDNKKMSRRS